MNFSSRKSGYQRCRQSKASISFGVWVEGCRRVPFFHLARLPTLHARKKQSEREGGRKYKFLFVLFICLHFVLMRRFIDCFRLIFQVYPAYNHSMRLDKSGHLCEPCASLYEDQMRAVLGGGAGLPSLDVVLLGLDSQGNSASFIKGHPIVSNEIHNYEVSVFLHAILIVCFFTPCECLVSAPPCDDARFGPDADARAGIPVHQWGAEGKTRPLRPNQVVTAMYECGEEIVDCELSDADLSLLKNRFPKERVSLGLSV